MCKDIGMSRRASDETAIRLSALEEDMLSLLVGKELYGLAIIDAMQEANGHAIGIGSLYPTLHRMELKGLIRSWWGVDTPEERGHARRRYYTATGLGQLVLTTTQRKRRLLAQWRPVWERG